MALRKVKVALYEAWNKITGSKLPLEFMNTQANRMDKGNVTTR